MNTDRRNSRNNPYVLDDFAANIHRSAAGTIWRWRTETALLAAFSTGTWYLSDQLGLVLAGLTVAAVIAAVAVIPSSRRYLTRRAWCLITRHRIQRVCWETRMHTRSGRIPLIMWTRPTEVGERAWVICRAGTCADDFDAHAAEIRTA